MNIRMPSPTPTNLTTEQLELLEELKDTKRQIADMFSFSALSPQEREEAIMTMSNLIVRESVARAIDVMHESDAKVMNEFLDTEPAEEEVFLYLLEHVEQFPEILEEVSAAFIGETLGDLEAVDEVLNEKA